MKKVVCSLLIMFILLSEFTACFGATNEVVLSNDVEVTEKKSTEENVDSKNFKIVIGVKTIKLGMVDSFLEVNEKNMNLEIKCEEKYMKIFEISKDRFKDILAESGFKASIRITKKIEDAEIDNCREFFGENNIAGIDIKV